MIPLFVFYIHIIAVVAIFTKRYQSDGIGEGFLAVFFMGLIFFVGWAMASFIMKLILPEGGLGVWFDRDSASLALLTISEAVLYYFYFRDDADAHDSAEDQPAE